MASSAVKEHTAMIKPNQLPSAPIKMGQDYQTTVSPNVSLAYFFRDNLDIDRLKGALQRVVNNNPEIAGRFKSKPFPQVSFEGDIGVPFHIIQLSDEHQHQLEGLSAVKVASKPLETMALWGAVGLVGSKWGEVCKDTDNAFCTVSVAQGRAFSVVEFSLSHATADADAYYQLLKAWDAEFETPGSTKPMKTRYDLQYKTSPQGGCCCMCAGLAKFIWPMMKRYGLATKKQGAKQKLDSAAIYAATSAQYDALKNAAVRETNDKRTAKSYPAAKQQVAEDSTVYVSGNDAHLAWLGNALKAKIVSQMMNVRGSNGQSQVKGEPIPDNYLGNALLPCGANSRKGGSFDAMDFRKAVKLYEFGSEGVTCCSHGCFAYSEYLLPTSWAKVQHRPKFGIKSGCYLQIPHLGEWIVYTMNVNVHCTANDGEHVFMQTALTPQQAESLRKACEEHGFVCTILSAEQVTKYWNDDPTKVHS